MSARWSCSLHQLPEVRVQRGEPGLLVGCGEVQEDTPTQQDGRQSRQDLQRVHLNERSKTGTCLSARLSLLLSVCHVITVSLQCLLAPPPQVNVDSLVRDLTNQSLRGGAGPASFQLAQDQIFSLMETDSYPRFLRSRLYSQLANHNAARTQTANRSEPGPAELTNQERAAAVVGQS